MAEDGTSITLYAVWQKDGDKNIEKSQLNEKNKDKKENTLPTIEENKDTDKKEKENHKKEENKSEETSKENKKENKKENTETKKDSKLEKKNISDNKNKKDTSLAKKEISPREKKMADNNKAPKTGVNDTKIYIAILNIALVGFAILKMKK